MRAYIDESNSFYYPDDDRKYPELNLSTFWGVLHGLRLGNKKFTVTKSTECFDDFNKEIYESDEVEVRHQLTHAERSLGAIGVYRGFVSFEEGSWVIRDDEDQYFEFLGSPDPRFRSAKKVVGNRFQKEIK